MSDPILPPSPIPAEQQGVRTFYTVEVLHGSSQELNDLACAIVRIGVESTILEARLQMLNRKHAPKILLRYEGMVQA